ncbi:hypothetical protein OG21DRAFT_1479305 [Imleria badia]|nr:hypothetical protein OG21DRAFT_1479305 [Imleria badia]
MAPSPSPPNQSLHNVPALSEIQTRAQEVFCVRPCRWQLKLAEAILKREKDVVCMAGTGMGHALTFWMPLLFRPDGIQIVVRSLNRLGKQDTTSLAEAGIQAVSISWETATLANFHAIRTFQYRVIVITPEQAMKPDGEFENLLSNPLFASRIISIVIDEAHCLIDRGRLRPAEYQELGRLRYVTVVVHRSSDRPNIKIGVKKIKYAPNSFDDLAFLAPAGFKVGGPPPPKFLVFFDDIDESVKAARVMRSRLPRELQDKIKWFNDDMSTIFKKTELENLHSGETWGLFTTMTFGTGMYVPDILLVVQWRATCTVAALWERFGHAVRDNGLAGTALLFAEKEYFDDEKAAKAARKARARRAETYIGSGDSADDDALQKRRPRKQELDPGLDFLINAETREGMDR